jgi:hypothetical protein
MPGEEMRSKTDEELSNIIRQGQNTNIPTSEFQFAKRELELRDREREQNVPWYKEWWMIYIIYPALGVLLGSIMTILIGKK